MKSFSFLQVKFTNNSINQVRWREIKANLICHFKFNRNWIRWVRLISMFAWIISYDLAFWRRWRWWSCIVNQLGGLVLWNHDNVGTSDVFCPFESFLTLATHAPVHVMVLRLASERIPTISWNIKHLKIKIKPFQSSCE